jgi:hypothetical protein
MGKKILYVLAMIFGGILQLVSLIRIPNTLSVLFSEVNIGYKAGYLIGLLIFFAVGFYFVRFGYRRLNPSKPKKKDIIDDIGPSL